MPRQFQFFASLLCLLQVFFRISTCQKEGAYVALSGGKAALQPAGVLLQVPAELARRLFSLQTLQPFLRGQSGTYLASVPLLTMAVLC